MLIKEISLSEEQRTYSFSFLLSFSVKRWHPLAEILICIFWQKSTMLFKSPWSTLKPRLDFGKHLKLLQWSANKKTYSACLQYVFFKHKELITYSKAETEIKNQWIFFFNIATVVCNYFWGSKRINSNSTKQISRYMSIVSYQKCFLILNVIKHYSEN